MCVMMMCFVVMAGEKNKSDISILGTDIDVVSGWTFTVDEGLKWIYKGKEHNFKELIKFVINEIDEDNSCDPGFYAIPSKIPEEMKTDDPFLYSPTPEFIEADLIEARKDLKSWGKFVEDDEPVYGFEPLTVYIGDKPYLKTFFFDGFSYKISKNFFEVFAKSGAICEVYGHFWWEGIESIDYDSRGNMLSTQNCAYWSNPRTFRQCHLCGKREFLKITWDKK